jgi:cell fate (sporulation/competence/biofilm development) regulator YlbF (YheA/YmcA/DUF963 family)
MKESVSKDPVNVRMIILMLRQELNEHETVAAFMLATLAPTHVILDLIDQIMVEVIVDF